MVTYFNKKDLVKFGEYLLTDERTENIQIAFNMKVISGIEKPMPVDEAVKLIYHSDIINWLEKQSK